MSNDPVLSTVFPKYPNLPLDRLRREKDFGSKAANCATPVFHNCLRPNDMY
jgi:hypothetical protein